MLADIQGIIDIGWLSTADTTKSCTDSEKYYLNSLWNLYIFQIQNSQ
jgi:hypothetical protein